MMLWIVLIALVGSLLLASLEACLERCGQLVAEEQWQQWAPAMFWRRACGALPWRDLLRQLRCAQGAYQLLFATAAALWAAPLLHLSYPTSSATYLAMIILVAVLIAGIGAAAVAARITVFFTESLALPLTVLATPFLFLLIPLSWVLRPLVTGRAPLKTAGSRPTREQVREYLLEVLGENSWGAPVDPKLLMAILLFKDRLVREVMVPRIDMFSLPSDTTIGQALLLFAQEGYSRIPIYEESVDQIIGVLLYKDLLRAVAEHMKSSAFSSWLDTSVAPLLKPVVYTPETKKISLLLQEFRHRQAHLSIVVDEYGGTEGIVTIEDILEELVGEIEDEFDIEEERLFIPLPNGSWDVDAKMGILDIEKELMISLPQGPEYDTIGGYIFHQAGAIPERGWRIHHEEFDLEVLSSTDRAIERIRITPRP